MAVYDNAALGEVDDNKCLNSIAIGSGVSTTQDYEIVIGGLVRDEIRVVMTLEEYSVVSRMLMRAVSNGS